MGIQLKKDETDGNVQDNIQENGNNSFPDINDQNNPESKFRGGIGDGTVDIDKINDLPAYTAPPVNNNMGVGAASGAEKRAIIYKIIGVLIILVVVFFIYRGVTFMTGSGGKDITNELTKTEEEIASDMKIKFEDNEARVRAIPQYANGTITVRSGKDIHVVYLDGEQVGVNSDSRKYRFFGVGINDPEKHALDNMTYQYDDCIVVLNDLMGGNSDTYFYYNKKNNDVFVLTINKNSARVVNMTYFTDYKRIVETLTIN